MVINYQDWILFIMIWIVLGSIQMVLGGCGVAALPPTPPRTNLETAF
jgi:hypothetical protein